jgi:hypothetical protein
MTTVFGNQGHVPGYGLQGSWCNSVIKIRQCWELKVLIRFIEIKESIC